MKRLIRAIVLLEFVTLSNCIENNVCPTYKDYNTIKTNPNCWYNYAADHNSTEMIKHHGYPLEIHKVTTEDGYILTLFRMPNAKKVPIFFHAGLYLSSASFISLGNESLAFLLWDAGYDIWLGNHRGTDYSEEHVNLTVYDVRYWDYNLDDIGLYDVPAIINYISEKTRKKIIYIGHSLGCATGMIYGSEFPQQSKKHIKLFILLSASIQLKHSPSSLRLAVPLFGQILDFLKSSGLLRLVSQGSVQKLLTKQMCLASPALMQFCLAMLNSAIGSPTQLTPELIPVAFNHIPAGTSFKVTKQIGDMMLSDFGRYNYDLGNLKKYGSKTPPIYNVSKIEIPVYILYSLNDLISNEKDTLESFNMLSPIARSYGKYEITVPDFNHNDFIFGKYAKQIAYDPILRLLCRFDKNC